MTATYLVFVDAPKKPKDTIASKYERAVVNTFPLSFLFTDTVPSLDIFSKCCFVIFKQLINNTTMPTISPYTLRVSSQSVAPF